MITPSQASAIAELFRQAADVLELNTHEGCPCADCSPRANARTDIRHDLRDWARDLDGLVRDAPASAETWSTVPRACEWCNDTGCDCDARSKCISAGCPGHWFCGWCPEHDKPRSVCGCLAPRRIFRDIVPAADGLNGAAADGTTALLSLCPHCSDPLCDDRCKEIR